MSTRPEDDGPPPPYPGDDDPPPPPPPTQQTDTKDPPPPPPSTPHPDDVKAATLPALAETKHPPTGLLPGDILVQAMGGSAAAPSYHILMMLTDGTGPKVAAHSSPDGAVSGARAFSMATLAHKEGAIRVFRCITTPGLGVRAARFGKSFARVINDACITVYGDDRATAGDAAVKAFSNDSLFRAVRAAYRGALEVSLSKKKGVTCSQFVTYCYQAAVAEMLIQQRRLHIPLILLGVMRPGWRQEHKESKEVPYQVARRNLDPTACTTVLGHLPDAFCWDAKSMNSEFLAKGLTMSVDFEHVGNLVLHGTGMRLGAAVFDPSGLRL